MRLIISADDFGLTEGVNRGILECFRNRAVTSTSIMANMEGFNDAVNIVRSNNELIDVGVHLVLTEGRPLLRGHTSIAIEEQFLNLEELRENILKINLEEVEEEWEAQVNKAFAANLPISHITSHHHVHELPKLLPVAVRIARRHKLRIRVYDWWEIFKNGGAVHSSSVFSGDFHGDVSKELFISILDKNLFKESLEIMCHPGYCDDNLRKLSSYAEQREVELKLLKGDWLSKELKKRDIELIGFRDL